MAEKKKAAELSAGLVAVKGSAIPAPDMQSRSSEPALSESGEVESNLAPLNFRVSSGFRREFKTYAAQHDLKLNELLRRSFEAYSRQKTR